MSFCSNQGFDVSHCGLCNDKVNDLGVHRATCTPALDTNMTWVFFSFLQNIVIRRAGSSFDFLCSKSLRIDNYCVSLFIFLSSIDPYTKGVHIDRRYHFSNFFHVRVSAHIRPVNARAHNIVLSLHWKRTCECLRPYFPLNEKCQSAMQTTGYVPVLWFSIDGSMICAHLQGWMACGDTGHSSYLESI